MAEFNGDNGGYIFRPLMDNARLEGKFEIVSHLFVPFLHNITIYDAVFEDHLRRNLPKIKESYVRLEQLIDRDNKLLPVTSKQLDRAVVEYNDFLYSWDPKYSENKALYLMGVRISHCERFVKTLDGEVHCIYMDPAGIRNSTKESIIASIKEAKNDWLRHLSWQKKLLVKLFGMHKKKLDKIFKPILEKYIDRDQFY